MKALWKKSTCGTYGEYARKILLSQPVAMTCRNGSLDSLIDAVNAMRADLAKLQKSPKLSSEDRGQVLSLVLDLKKTFYQIAELCIPK